MVNRVAVVIGVAALVMGLGAVPAVAAAGGANTATVCRITGDGTTAAAQNVNEHAVQAFLRKGDSVPGDTVVGTQNEDVWSPDCIALPKKVFAIAYSNLDGLPGYNTRSRDVLIAKLFDDNNDGTLSPGDKINTFKYPLTYTPAVFADFGSFQVTQHTVTGIAFSSATSVDLSIDGVDYAGFAHGVEFEYYFEQAPSTDTSVGSPFFVWIQDTADGPDRLEVHTGAPSDPATPVSFTPTTHGPDDAFINVEMTP